MTSSNVVHIADLIKVQLKHATGQTYLHMGHPIMFWDKYAAIERQSHRTTHKKITCFHVYSYRFWLDYTDPSSHFRDKFLYRCILMMLWLLHIFPLWIFVIAA